MIHRGKFGFEMLREAAEAAAGGSLFHASEPCGSTLRGVGGGGACVFKILKRKWRSETLSCGFIYRWKEPTTHPARSDSDHLSNRTRENPAWLETRYFWGGKNHLVKPLSLSVRYRDADVELK